MLINASSYGSIAAAIAAAAMKPGTTLVVDVPVSPTTTITTKTIMELVFAAGLNGAKCPGCTVLLDSPCGVYGYPGIPSITNSQYSAIMATANASGSVLDGVSAVNFNTLAENPQAAFFLYSSGAPVSGIRARNLSATNGHGNCLRLANVYDCIVRDCDFSLTLAESNNQAAEILTIDGSKILIAGTRMDRALTSGLLVWPGANRYDIKIIGNTVSNSSQAVLPAGAGGIGQIGSNFAYVLNAQQFTLTGVVFDQNSAFDSQLNAKGAPAPTQEGLLQVGNGLLGGKIVGLCVPRSNPHWGNILDTQTYDGVSYDFDNQASELVGAVIA